MNRLSTRPAPYQYPFRAAIEGATASNRRAAAPCSTPVVTPLTAAQLALQMAQEVEAQSAVNGRFYKTRMCLFHQKGACVKGSACSYAHCESELRPAPDLMKTRLCQDWLNGNCTSHVCKFAHGRHELRFTHDFYKTKICHFWQQGGCTKGVFCRHAHGAHELRTTLESDDEADVRGVMPSGSRSSTRSSNRSSPRATDNTAAVFEALRLASEARKLVERGAELLMQQSEATPLAGGVSPSRRIGHRSQPSCTSERFKPPNSPLPPYGTAGSGLTVTTAAPTYTGTPTHCVNSPALSFAMPDEEDLVDQLLESLLPPANSNELCDAITTILNGWEAEDTSPKW